MTGSTTSGKDISSQIFKNLKPDLTDYFGHEIESPCDRNTRIKLRLSDRKPLPELLQLRPELKKNVKYYCLTFKLFFNYFFQLIVEENSSLQGSTKRVAVVALLPGNFSEKLLWQVLVHWNV